MKGEAGKYPTLRQQDLHIVAVGTAPRQGENAADELLRQLITLPRPVRVEFAKTPPATTTTASPPPPTTSAPGSFKHGKPLQQEEPRTTPPFPVKEANSRTEKGQSERELAERKEGHGGEIAVEPPLRVDARNREAGAIVGEILTSAGGEEQPQGGNAGLHDDAPDPVASEDDEESRRDDASQRPPPQRHGTLPSVGWQEGRVDVVGVGVGDDGENVGQRPRGAEGQDGQEQERHGRPDRHRTEGALTTGEERQGHAPRRPQRHGTLPEGIDWEENLRSGRGGTAVDPRTTPAAAAQSEESEETSWSMAEEANFRSSPINGSHSPRSFYNPNAKRSHLVLTPEGSESSAWSNSRVHTDGVESIQRWLQVRTGLQCDRQRGLFVLIFFHLVASSAFFGTAMYRGIEISSAFPKRSQVCSAKQKLVLFAQHGHDALIS